MALIVATWRWGAKYGDDYVARLAAGVARCTKDAAPLRVFRPEPQDEYLTRAKGCFARLRMFDPAWQARHGIWPGDRIVCLDLDLIITGQVDPVFAVDEPFAILLGANASNPCPYNGSLFSLIAGYRPDVWSYFSLEAAARVPFYEFPDDQAWLAHKLPGAASWRVGADTGVYAFQKPGWPKGNALPSDAKMVCFPGHRDPAQFTHLRWVREHWRV